VFNRHFTDKASSVHSWLPPDWDIVLWGWNFNSILEVELLPGMKRSGMHFDPAKLVEGTKEFQEESYDILPLRFIHLWRRLLVPIAKGCRGIDPKVLSLEERDD
jgi:hypothetical protein